MCGLWLVCGWVVGGRFGGVVVGVRVCLSISNCACGMADCVVRKAQSGGECWLERHICQMITQGS